MGHYSVGSQSKIMDTAGPLTTASAVSGIHRWREPTEQRVSPENRMVASDRRIALSAFADTRLPPAPP